jgi:general secretion pathway protein K
MVLVTVLWTITLLSTLAMATAVTFRSFAGVMIINDKKAEIQGLLTGGMEVGADMLRRQGDAPLLGIETTLNLAAGSVRIRLEDEGGRIDIGKAPVEVLSAMFSAIGVARPDTAAAQTINWRSQQSGGRPIESEVTPPQDDKTAGANMPFSDVHDLANVPGMLPEWVAAAAPLTTVFGNATINPLTAPANVLASLPGVKPASLQTFLAIRQRTPNDATRLIAQFGAAQSYLAAKAPQAVAVRLLAKLDGGYAAAAEAIIVLPPGDDQPYRVLAWNPLDLSQESEDIN